MSHIPTLQAHLMNGIHTGPSANASAARVTPGDINARSTSTPSSPSSSTPSPSRRTRTTQATIHPASTPITILRRRRRRRGQRHTLSPPEDWRSRAHATALGPGIAPDPAFTSTPPLLSSWIPQSTAEPSSFSFLTASPPDMPHKHRPARPRFWLAGQDEDIESVYPAPGGFDESE